MALPSSSYMQPVEEQSDLNIASLYTPAKDVGGDFHSVMELDGGYGVLVADIVGKGVRAAFQSKRVKAIFNDILPQYRSPQQALAKLNDILAEQSDIPYVPVIYGIYTPKDRKFTYCNAGHEPGVCVSNGIFHVLSPSGAPLGVEDRNENYKDEEITLKDQDLLALFTDGVVDISDVKGEKFGHERFYDFIDNNRKVAPKEFIDRYTQFVNRYTEDVPQTDDITLVVLKIGASADTAASPDSATTFFLNDREEIIRYVNEVLTFRFAYPVAKYDIMVGLWVLFLASCFDDNTAEISILDDHDSLKFRVKGESQGAIFPLAKFKLKQLFSQVQFQQHGDMLAISFEKMIRSPFRESKHPVILGVGVPKEHQNTIGQCVTPTFTYINVPTFEEAKCVYPTLVSSIKIVLVWSELNDSEAQIGVLKAENCIPRFVLLAPEEDVSACIDQLSKDCSDYLTVPIDPQKLVDSVNEIYEKIDEKQALIHYSGPKFFEELTQCLDETFSAIKRIQSESGPLSEGDLFSFFSPGESETVKSIQDLLDAEVEKKREESRFTILYVEDEEHVRQNTSRLLKEMGYRMLQAGNADEAIAVAKSDPDIDICLIDIGLPGVSGIELIKKLKPHLRPHTEVVMLTAFKNVPSVTSAFKRGAVQYLTKPCDDFDMLDCLDDVVRQVTMKKMIGTNVKDLLLDRQNDMMTKAYIFQQLVRQRTEEQGVVAIRDLYGLFPHLVGIEVPNIDKWVIPKNLVNQSMLRPIEDLEIMKFLKENNV